MAIGRLRDALQNAAGFWRANGIAVKQPFYARGVENVKGPWQQISDSEKRRTLLRAVSFTKEI